MGNELFIFCFESLHVPPLIINQLELIVIEPYFLVYRVLDFNNTRFTQDKVSELEAEMEDTGQMIAARLTALETPRRKETDDSDEAGSSSSCSSINQMIRLGRSDEEKSESKKVDFDTSHQKLSDSIKSLQDARSSPDFG